MQMVTYHVAGVGKIGKATWRIHNVLCGRECRLTIPELCAETGKDEYAATKGPITHGGAEQHLKWHLERNRHPNRPKWAGDVRGPTFVRGLCSDGNRWWIDPVKAAALPPCSCCGPREPLPEDSLLDARGPAQTGHRCGALTQG
jgi:hypothetical protein